MSEPPRWILVLAVASALGACQHASTDAESTARGEQIFSSVCSRCHGVNGAGGTAVGGANPPRNFCDAAFQASRSDEDLKQVIQVGKGGMPAFGTLFSESDLRGLVHKVRAFTPAVAVSIDPAKGH
jgi:mono/diheme cytochrome c family protein